MSGRPDWWLERVLLGEIPGVDRSQLTEDEQARYDGLIESNQRILERFPPAGVVEEVTRRARLEARRSRSRRGWWTAGLASAVTATAVAIVDFSVGSEGPERSKGVALETAPGASFAVHRKTPMGAERLRSGALINEGDLLQISYGPGGRGHGAVVSVDGRGVVTLHWPEWGAGVLPEFRAEGATLGKSYQLDDAPAFERFWLVECEEPVPVERITRAARRWNLQGAQTNDLELPGCTTQSQLFVKPTGSGGAR
ncbi:MAG: hypothetical protein ACFB9M_05390 [Myxococcota bacterium]